MDGGGGGRGERGRGGGQGGGGGSGEGRGVGGWRGAGGREGRRGGGRGGRKGGGEEGEGRRGVGGGLGGGEGESGQQTLSLWKDEKPKTKNETLPYRSKASNGRHDCSPRRAIGAVSPLVNVGIHAARIFFSRDNAIIKTRRKKRATKRPRTEKKYEKRKTEEHKSGEGVAPILKKNTVWHSQPPAPFPPSPLPLTGPARSKPSDNCNSLYPSPRLYCNQRLRFEIGWI